MKITICGSMYHIEAMLKAAATLKSLGYEVETPNLSEGESFAKLQGEERHKAKHGLIREHLEKIRHSDAILVFNEEKKGVAGYIGGNTLMEMAFAFAQDIDIFMLNHAQVMSYADEIYGMQPIVLDGDMGNIKSK